MRTRVLFAALAVAAVSYAKDIKTVVLKTQPEMHCMGCEKKIKYEATEVKSEPEKKVDAVTGATQKK